MLTSSSASTSSPTPSSNPNSSFTFTPPSAAGVVLLAAFALVLAFFFAGSGTASSCSSSSCTFSFSPSRSAPVVSFCFHPLFLEAGVADAVPVPAVAFLFGVRGCGVVLLLVLLVWSVEERAPYLLKIKKEQTSQLRSIYRMEARGVSIEY
jgi:hypothetical protein